MMRQRILQKNKSSRQGPACSLNNYSNNSIIITAIDKYLFEKLSPNSGRESQAEGKVV